ncbi:MAG TPA: AgmX/PglI C-terminal domain-containing protein [Candidatus Binatia bacterium]|nr:AgmX/PglI C-terminal domain-containing protein [Candidatus Binatia bacterium]
MSRFFETKIQQSETVAERIDNELASAGQQIGIGNENVARIAILAVAATGILVLPFVTLFSNRAHLLVKQPVFVGSQSRTVDTESAVLAVDTFGLDIQAKNNSALTRELLEQTAVQHLARLHRTYSRWADKNGDVMGRILLKLAVDANGKVASVDPLASHVTNSNFEKIVMEGVRKWNFPKAGVDGTEITVPLLFVPKGMDPHTVVQWERKVRSVQEEEEPAASLRVVNKATRVKAPTVVERSSTAKPSTSPSIQPSTSKSATVSLPQPKKEEVLIAAKTNRFVTIRDNPRFSAKKVHEVDEDTQLNILETQGDWLKVRIVDAGFTGFVRKEFVSPVN